MSKIHFLIRSVVVLMLLLPIPGSSFAQEVQEPPAVDEFVAGEVLVKFRAGVTPTMTASGVDLGTASLNALMAEYIPFIVLLTALPPLAAQDPRSTLRLAAPITRWDEAVPIGNGLLGGLLWGEASTLKLSLDRGDLWDEPPTEIFKDPEWTCSPTSASARRFATTTRLRLAAHWRSCRATVAVAAGAAARATHPRIR